MKEKTIHSHRLANKLIQDGAIILGIELHHTKFGILVFKFQDDDRLQELLALYNQK